MKIENDDIKIIKNEDHILFKNSSGEYHLSLEDFEKLGKKRALEFAIKEIEKKLSSKFKGKTINFQQARGMGFCEYGIREFCDSLGLDINENHNLSKIYSLLDDSKLELLFKYPQEILKLFGLDVFKKNEGAISKDDQLSYWYAMDILKGRFEAGEEAIATNAAYSYYYAKNVLEGRFEAGEEAITTNAKYSYCYAKNVLEGRFEAGEEAITTNAEYSYLYAKHILKGRFEKGEEAISKSSYYSCCYEEDILKSK